MQALLGKLKETKIAGTNGPRKLTYTLQSAYPPTHTDDEATASVRSHLSVNEVKAIQKKLKLTTDGIFGRNTLLVVKMFQGANGLVVDGYSGKVTKAFFERTP